MEADALVSKEINMLVRCQDGEVSFWILKDMEFHSGKLLDTATIVYVVL